MLTCRRTLQIQLQLNPRQGSVNDCDLAVLTFTAHAELEATCASGISETKHSTRGLVDQSVSPCSHSELPSAKAHSFRPPKRQIPRRTAATTPLP